MTERETGPIVLGDEPDGGVDERGWVEATVPEPDARKVLIDTMLGDDPEVTFGEGRKVTLRPKERDDDQCEWPYCEPGHAGAREFWEFELVEREGE